MVFSAKKIILRWYNLIMFRAFGKWRGKSNETKRMTSKARAIILKLSNSKLNAAWHTWTDMSERKVRLRTIGMRTIARWRSLLLSEAFVVWENRVSLFDQARMLACMRISPPSKECAAE